MSLELGISTAFVFLYQRIGTKVSMSLHIFTRCLVILPKLLMLVQFCIECLVINLELLGTYGDDWLLSSVLLGYIWSAKRNMILIEITSWNLSEIRSRTMTEIFDRKYHKKLIRQEEKNEKLENDLNFDCRQCLLNIWQIQLFLSLAPSYLMLGEIVKIHSGNNSPLSVASSVLIL